MIYQAIYDSPLGDISVQSDGENVTALYFVGQRYDGTMEEGSFESLESLPLWKTVIILGSVILSVDHRRIFLGLLRR